MKTCQHVEADIVQPTFAKIKPSNGACGLAFGLAASWCFEEVRVSMFAGYQNLKWDYYSGLLVHWKVWNPSDIFLLLCVEVSSVASSLASNSKRSLKRPKPGPFVNHQLSDYD